MAEATKTKKDTGPGTGADAPDEDTPRTPDRAVSHGGAAPLVAPDAASQVAPAEGHATSSVDAVAAQSGLHSFAGENHIRLTDADGGDLDPATLFVEDSPHKTFLVTGTRVFEEFLYPNTHTVARRLLYPEGRRVDRQVAGRLLAAVEQARAQTAQIVRADEG